MLLSSPSVPISKVSSRTPRLGFWKVVKLVQVKITLGVRWVHRPLCSRLLLIASRKSRSRWLMDACYERGRPPSRSHSGSGGPATAWRRQSTEGRWTLNGPLFFSYILLGGTFFLLIQRHSIRVFSSIDYSILIETTTASNDLGNGSRDLRLSNSYHMTSSNLPLEWKCTFLPFESRDVSCFTCE